jgi:hypothetical protein
MLLNFVAPSGQGDKPSSQADSLRGPVDRSHPHPSLQNLQTGRGFSPLTLSSKDNHCAICQPRATDPKESPVENTILDKANNHRRSTIRIKVCRLNDEKVVKPPQIPMTSNCCKALARLLFATCIRKPEKTPARIEPEIFTANVPKGNVSPRCCVTRPTHQ